MIEYPIRIPAIRVNQPLGIFYSAAIPASVLLDVSYSIRAELLEDDGLLMGKLRRLRGGNVIEKLADLKK